MGKEPGFWVIMTSCHPLEMRIDPQTLEAAKISGGDVITAIIQASKRGQRLKDEPRATFWTCPTGTRRTNKSQGERGQSWEEFKQMIQDILAQLNMTHFTSWFVKWLFDQNRRFLKPDLMPGRSGFGLATHSQRCRPQDDNRMNKSPFCSTPVIVGALNQEWGTWLPNFQLSAPMFFGWSDRPKTARKWRTAQSQSPDRFSETWLTCWREDVWLKPCFSLWGHPSMPIKLSCAWVQKTWRKRTFGTDVD